MARGGSRRRPGRALVGVLLVLGCAGELAAVDGGFRHRRHGYVFDAPASPWRRIDVEYAVIAYRGPGPATMSLQSRCGRPVAEPAVMARHLLVGLPERVLRQAGPIAVAGRDGWTQTFDTLEEGLAVRVKTVTVVAKACTLDWILVARGAFEEAEVVFDAWIASVRIPREAAVAGGEP